MARLFTASSSEKLVVASAPVTAFPFTMSIWFRPTQVTSQLEAKGFAFTDGAQMDSLSAGEAFRLKLRRDADGTSGTDDVTTDAELLLVEVKET